MKNRFTRINCLGTVRVTRLLIILCIFSVAIILLPRVAVSEPGPNCQQSTSCTEQVGCPSITSYGAIDRFVFCVNQGQSPSMPQLTNQPTQTVGKKIVICVTTQSDCSQTSNSSTNDVAFSFSGLKYNPAPPTSSSPPGAYQSDCYIDATTSETNKCPSQKINFGKVTWNVMSTNCVVIQQYFTGTNGWVIAEVGFAGDPAGGGAFHQYDGFTVKFTANVTAVCQIGCSTTTNSGVKVAEFEHTDVFDTIEVYNVGQGGVTVPLPTSLPGAVGELIGAIIGEQISFFGVDGTTLTRIANKILQDKSTLSGPGSGSWKDGKVPCCP